MTNVYLWQMPHFLAIAWLYREDYARGGHEMLPVRDHEQAAREARAKLTAWKRAYVEREESRDLGLRVFIGRRQATVSASDLSPATQARLVERAVAMAREAPEQQDTVITENLIRRFWVGYQKLMGY